MGEETMQPESAEGAPAASTATASAALDARLWDPLGSAAVLRSQPQFDETVLDAWCGDGSSALPAAALVGPAGRVDAIDPDEALVAVARDRGADLPQLQVQVADPADWPTGDYDLVQCVLGLASCATPDDTARHLASLVKPGGRLVVSLWAAGALEPLAELARDALADAAGRGDGDDDETDAPDDTHGSAGTDASDEADSAGRVARDEGARVSRPADAEADEPEASHDEDTPEEGEVPDEACEDSTLPGTAGTLATLLHDLGLVDVRAERVDRHLDVDGELAWQLVLDARLLPSEALDALDEEARGRVRQRVLEGVAERELTRVDVSTLIAVGHRAV